MSAALRSLNSAALVALAAKLERGIVSFPPSTSELHGYAADRASLSALSECFAAMAAKGMQRAAAAWVLRTLAEEREATWAAAPKVHSVWSGLDREGLSLRAKNLLQDLFSAARFRVWIATYNLDKGTKARKLFGHLAERHDRGELEVRIFANIKRGFNQHGRSEEEVIASFAKDFAKEIWPGARLPELYYDPRALDDDGRQQSCLHAKAVMIDENKVLITSANFSEAAQERNIEAGVLIEDESTTQDYCRNFQRLIEENLLKRLI